MISEKTLQKIINGKLNPNIINIPFIISKDRITSNFFNDFSYTEYSFIYGPKTDGAGNLTEETVISANTAGKLIKLYKMHPVASNENATIYEMDGNPFKARYGKKHPLC